MKVQILYYFRELREKRGITYDVYNSPLDTTKAVKTLYIYTAVQESLIKETIKVIDNCIEQIKWAIWWNDDNMFVLIKR